MFNDDVNGGIVGQSGDNRLPCVSVVVTAINVGTVVVALVTIESSVNAAFVEARGNNASHHRVGRRQPGHVAAEHHPISTGVARAVNVAIIRAYIEHVRAGR